MKNAFYMEHLIFYVFDDAGLLDLSCCTGRALGYEGLAMVSAYEIITALSPAALGTRVFRPSE